MDAELVSSGSIDGHIYMWNARTGSAITRGQIVHKLSGHLDSITAVVFVDNQHLISSSWDDTLHIWDLSTGKSSRWTNSGRIASSNSALDGQATTPLAVSPDNSLMASALWKDVILSKVLSSGDTAHYNLSAHKKEVTAVAFSPNQDFIVSGSKDTTVRIWNVSDQTQILDAMFGHSDEISSVAYSYNNKLVASGSKDKTICIWNAKTGSLVKKLHSDSAVLAVSFSPSGEYVVTGSSNNSIHIWDINAAVITSKSLHGHSAPVISVTFSTDGKFVMSGASDHVVCIWDATTGESVKKLVNILHASS
jgi:WD40 repeat protein